MPSLTWLVRVIVAGTGAVALSLAVCLSASAGPSDNPGHGVGAGWNSGQFGDTTQPQPRSNADRTGHGANVSGPYDSTRDGSPSLNGNGNGAAVGKPCAGCVGRADNKNPHGQLPGGSDANAGYECDRSNGVGKSNPAHTACRSTTPPQAPGTPGVPGTPPVPGTPAGPGSHANPAAPASPAAPKSKPESAAATSGLASTGADLLEPMALGLALLGAGGTVIGLAVRRPARRPGDARSSAR